MGFRINTNIGALNAHANSVVNANELDKSLSRLSLVLGLTPQQMMLQGWL